MATNTETKFDVPETCKAGVVVNEGPNFHLEVVDVPVPKPGHYHPLLIPKQTNLIHLQAPTTSSSS